MAKTISRTFTYSVVSIYDAISEELISKERGFGKTSLKSEMKNYLKTTEEKDLKPVRIEIAEELEKREMSVEDFFKHSTIVVQQETDQQETDQQETDQQETDQQETDQQETDQQETDQQETKSK